MYTMWFISGKVNKKGNIEESKIPTLIRFDSAIFEKKIMSAKVWKFD